MMDWEIVEDVEQLREQISLLTMKLNFEKDWRKGQEELASRISKAKTILTVVLIHMGRHDDIQSALDVLEGK